MSIDKQRIWSGSDFPYQCLVDVARTGAFRAAILATVKPGDVVLDAGSGSGILSFFSAQAGARQVLAVEFDPFVGKCLEESVKANGLSDTITVIRGDVCSVSLPKHVDVFIAEMIDTGLIDEMQAEVINCLREKGVLGPRTRMIPSRYETRVELGSADLEHFGFRILLPQHRWPHQAYPHTGWSPCRFEPLSDALMLASLDFNASIRTEVNEVISFIPSSDGEVNAIRITGCAYLTDAARLGATNAFNGDKVVPIEPVRLYRGREAQVSIRLTLGAGFSSLQVVVSCEGPSPLRSHLGSRNARRSTGVR